MSVVTTEVSFSAVTNRARRQSDESRAGTWAAEQSGRSCSQQSAAPHRHQPPPVTHLLSDITSDQAWHRTAPHLSIATSFHHPPSLRRPEQCSTPPLLHQPPPTYLHIPQQRQCLRLTRPRMTCDKLSFLSVSATGEILKYRKNENYNLYWGLWVNCSTC